MACTLEGSDFTSVQRRIQELEQFTGTAPSSDPVAFAAAVEQVDSLQAAEEGAQSVPTRADWLTPLALDKGRHAEPGPQASSSGVRCSDKGVLPMRLEDYLQLLDWTGRQLARGKPGAIPEQLPPILERLGIGGDEPWLKLSSDFGRIFHRVAGRGRHAARRAHAPRPPPLPRSPSTALRQGLSTARRRRTVTARSFSRRSGERSCFPSAAGCPPQCNCPGSPRIAVEISPLDRTGP